MATIKSPTVVKAVIASYETILSPPVPSFNFAGAPSTVSGSLFRDYSNIPKTKSNQILAIPESV